MFIDSPNFIKRKVLNAKTTNDPQSPSKPQKYIYGLERAMLANHVANCLNEHEQDYQILQRFRKEAEQLKRNKFNSKKVASVAIHVQSKQPISEPKRQPQKSSQYLYQYPQPEQNDINFQQNTIASRITQTKVPNQVQFYEQPPIVSHYQKIIKSKDKQLKRKQRKLQKSRLIIRNMSLKLKDIENHKKILVKEEEVEMMRINSIIQQINSKLQENRSLFKEEINRLKYDLAPVKSSPFQRNNTYQQIKNKSLPIRQKINIVKPYDSERFLQGPSVYYDPKQSDPQLIDRTIIKLKNKLRDY